MDVCMEGVKLSWVSYLNNEILHNYIDVGWKLGLLVWKLPIFPCIFILGRVDGYRFFTKGSKGKVDHGSI